MKAFVVWAIVGVLGVLLVVGGVLTGWVIKPMVLHNKLDLNDVGSEGYENFIKPPVDVLIKFYFMEVQNAAQLLEGDLIPILWEKGPYTFKETREKKEISRPSEQFLNFGQYVDYKFEPDLSCDGCTRDDEVTILNMPLMGFIASALDEGIGGYSALQSLNTTIRNGEVTLEDAAPFVKTNVGDFLFDGVDNTLITWLFTNALTNDILPPPFQGGKFAIFNGKVNSAENECYQVETGAVSWDRHTMITKYGKDLDNLMDTLADMETLSVSGDDHWGAWWEGKDSFGNSGDASICNMLKGTDGQQFPPGVNSEEKLWIFNTLPCRSVFLDFLEEQEVEGITTYRYVVPLDGANVNKTMNFCACSDLQECVECNGTVTEDCFKRSDDDPDTLDISLCEVEKCYDGLQDISKCQGAPTFLSYPHFYLAPEQEIKFGNLKPDKSLHETFLNVEPNTGMSVKLHSRIQLNTPVTSNEDLPTNPYVPSIKVHLDDVLRELQTVTAFPILWLDQGADIEDDPDMVDHLKSQLLLLTVSDILKWVLIGVGAAATVGGAVLTFVKYSSK